MAKFSTKTALPFREAQELMVEFFESIGRARGAQEMATIFQDLVSRQELIMIAKRLKIASLLLEGKTFETIIGEAKTSMATVARVSAWLNAEGEGFRLLHQRALRRQPKPERSDWRSVRRRYPMYYWPQLLLEEVVRTASRRQRERLRETIERMAEKPRVYRDVLRSLRS